MYRPLRLEDGCTIPYHGPNVYELTKVVVVTYTMPKLDYASLHLNKTNFQTSQWTIRLGDYVF